MDTSKKTALAEQAYQLAFDYELKYGCCPQCVLTTVKETIGYVTDDVIKAAHGLSGGGGLSGTGTCGALTGGLVALSCKRGRERDKFDKGKYLNNFRSGQKLIDRFTERFGAVTCQELQEKFTGQCWDMWNTEEYTSFDKARGIQCAEATALVSKWVVELM